MSHRKNRERAESGWLFRDGRLVPAEDVKGTPANLSKQAAVDKAVAEIMGRKAGDGKA